MSLEDDRGNTFDKLKECDVYVGEKELDEALENHNIEPYVVLMDENGKIYTRHTFFAFMKLFNLRVVFGDIADKNTLNNMKNKVNHNTGNQAQKDSSFISILKLIIWIIITILCLIISLELFRLLECVV